MRPGFLPALAAALCLLALIGCQQLNPNSGRFSCDAGPDCGEGFECRAQFSGGGRCFKLGECVDAEVCDGADENCDGRIDESFPEDGQPCPTGALGECAAGTRICTVGTLACMQSRPPTAELCNGRDDDCDGATDENFDFTSDESNCGGCGRTCDAGTTCLGASCQESTCDDGNDNDLDGVTDCLDESCLGQVCVTPMPPPWRCGARNLDGGFPDAGPDAGLDDGGADAGPDDGGFDAGTWDGGPVLGCYAPEQDCANGFDDDGDGEADCLDVDCAGRTCASGTICTNRSCPGPG
ncbi:MAG: MopE-related protein [Archangium sp.]|nr:MopE-related protein [Archangium sp.]